MKSAISRRALAIRAIVLASLALAVALPVHAQQAAAAQKKAPAPSESQVMAREILMRMAAHLGGAGKFSVSLRAGYDAVQKSGQKIEFNEIRKVVLDRPDRLRVETERSDGAKTLAVFDGRGIIVVDAASNAYATAPQPGDIDRSVAYFVKDLGMRLPLSMLLLARLPAELEARLKSVDYVEKSTVFGQPAHHLAARTDTVDFQIWVADGDQPVPLRVVITYRKQAGQPQFWAQFADWNFTPAIGNETFTAQIPQGAQKVAFAAQLKRAGAKGAKP